MSCKSCKQASIYRCNVCGKKLCVEHTRLRTVCKSCIKKTVLRHIVNKVTTDDERKHINKFMKRFWGEEEQLTFDKKLKIVELPAYVAKVKNQIVGFVSFADADDSLIIAALGVLPEYQNSDIGKSLVTEVEAEAKRVLKKWLLVSTSNDDLPALAFYQSLGFQIYEVKPNVIAEKHGKIISGIGGLPIRDEVRLRKALV